MILTITIDVQNTIIMIIVDKLKKEVQESYSIIIPRNMSTSPLKSSYYLFLYSICEMFDILQYDQEIKFMLKSYILGVGSCIFEKRTYRNKVSERFVNYLQ